MKSVCVCHLWWIKGEQRDIYQIWSEFWREWKREANSKSGLNFGERERERERESPDNSWILEWKINKQAQERPESPTVFSPGMRVNTRYINTRGTSSVGCMYHWWSLCTLYWGSDSGGVYVPCIGVVTGGVYGPCIYLRARWELL